MALIINRNNIIDKDIVNKSRDIETEIEIQTNKEVYKEINKELEINYKSLIHAFSSL